MAPESSGKLGFFRCFFRFSITASSTSIYTLGMNITENDADELQWGTEHLFSKHFSSLPGFKAEVGYTGGASDSPSESGSIGHELARRRYKDSVSRM